MKKQTFYTIVANGKFINANFMEKPTKKIIDAIKFVSIEATKAYLEILKMNKGYKIVKVDCSYQDI